MVETPQEILDKIWASLNCVKYNKAIRKPTIELRRQHATGQYWESQHKITLREDSWNIMHPAEKRLVTIHEGLHACNIGHQKGFRSALDPATDLIYRRIYGEDDILQDFNRILAEKLKNVFNGKEVEDTLQCDPNTPNTGVCE